MVIRQRRRTDIAHAVGGVMSKERRIYRRWMAVVGARITCASLGGARILGGFVKHIWFGRRVLDILRSSRVCLLHGRVLIKCPLGSLCRCGYSLTLSSFSHTKAKKYSKNNG